MPSAVREKRKDVFYGTGHILAQVKISIGVSREPYSACGTKDPTLEVF